MVKMKILGFVWILYVLDNIIKLQLCSAIFSMMIYVQLYAMYISRFENNSYGRKMYINVDFLFSSPSPIKSQLKYP